MDVVNSLKPGKNGTQRHDGELIAKHINTLAKSHTQPFAQQTAGAALRICLNEKYLQLTVKQPVDKWHPYKNRAADLRISSAAGAARTDRQ